MNDFETLKSSNSIYHSLKNLLRKKFNGISLLSYIVSCRMGISTFYVDVLNFISSNKNV